MKSFLQSIREQRALSLDQPQALRIRAFRAVDEPEACRRFSEGHSQVLKNHGVTNVASAQESWQENESVYAVLVESPDGTTTHGGARIHIADGKTPLPIEDAIGGMDPKLAKFIENERHDGLGEICGLWNSLEVAGMGIGSVYLIRCGLSLVVNLDIHKMFALCSPFTNKMAAGFGFFPLREIGDHGTFPYPNERLLATVTYQADTKGMEGAKDSEKEIISDLRKSPKQKKIETARNGITVEVEYQLRIK